MPHGHAQDEFANGNTAGGDGALDNLTTGKQNTALGAEALHENTVGDENTALGSKALRNNASGAGNTATGVNALLENTTGEDRVKIPCPVRVHSSDAPGIRTATARNRDRQRERGWHRCSCFVSEARRRRENDRRNSGVAHLKKSASVTLSSARRRKRLCEKQRPGESIRNVNAFIRRKC